MIKENIARVKERIISACLKAKREPAGIKLIVVSKNRGVEEIKEAVSAGLSEFGENRVQEAVLKYKELSLTAYRLPLIKWHMVGHLQTNKVREAVKIFDLIQSVDSLRLALEIDKEALRINKIQDILLEVKVSPEATKFGLKPEEIIEVTKEVSGLKNINIKGLMAIAPIADNPEKVRPYFRMLRELQDKINSLQLIAYRLQLLSMGMTDDFETAIEEGSNMVRIGRAIFEN